MCGSISLYRFQRRDVPRCVAIGVNQNIAAVRNFVDGYKDGLSSSLAKARADPLCLDATARTAWS
jgi:hypothetical protein